MQYIAVILIRKEPQLFATDLSCFNFVPDLLFQIPTLVRLIRVNFSFKHFQKYNIFQRLLLIPSGLMFIVYRLVQNY
jgi:hypothetical protein